MSEETQQALEPAPAAAPSEIDVIGKLGWMLAAAESGSKEPKALAMAAALRIAWARSLGLPDHAANQIHIINGVPATSAQLQRAQAFTQGYQIIPTHQSDTACTVVIIDRRTNEPLVNTHPVTFTMEDAKRMGLLDKRGQNWTRIPQDMLFARATTKAIRTYIPHVALGVVAIEEAYDVVEGEVVDDVPFGDVD